MYYFDSHEFCPRCSLKLEHRKEFIVCPSCGHHIFDNPKPCVNVILGNNKGEILLVVRKINPFKGWLDLPGGFIQSGETLEAAAIREAKEEINVDLKVGGMVGNCTAEYKYDGLVYKLLVFVVSGKADVSKIRVGDDASSFKFIPKGKVLKAKICFPEVNKTLIKKYLNS